MALREQADLAEDDVRALDAKLERLDRASSHGAWTKVTLDLIGRRPHTRAPDLAEERCAVNETRSRSTSANSRTWD